MLSAAGQNISAAAWMLTELHAPGTPAGMSPAASPLPSPSISPYASPRVSPRASPRSSPLRQPYVQQRPPKDASPPPPSHRVPDAATRTEDADDAKQDAYWRFRADALQLTKQWQKAARKATTAFAGGHRCSRVHYGFKQAGFPLCKHPRKVFSCKANSKNTLHASWPCTHPYAGGDHSAAHKYAREARVLRNKALAAHEGAARRIEAANNDGRDSWTLDLHGLHGQEAVAAVDRRSIHECSTSTRPTLLS